MEWNKVEDKLPESYKYVLCIVNGSITEGSYSANSKSWDFLVLPYHGHASGCDHISNHVTHWAELPPLPD